MNTLEKIQAMDRLAYVQISALLTRGNVTLQGGGIFTMQDCEKLFDRVLSTELGEN